MADRPARRDDRFLHARGQLFDRLETGTAWSQVPRSRTVHLITNVELFATDDDSLRMVRSNFLISEFRAGESRVPWRVHQPPAALPASTTPRVRFSSMCAARIRQPRNS